MKKEKFILLYILIAVTSATSCNKWLEVQPKTQIETSKLFSTETGFADAMYGVYTTMAGPALYGDQLTMSFVDVLAQRYDCSAPTHNYNQASIYNYMDNITRSRINRIWDTMYYAVANVNNVLQFVDEKKDVFQPGNYDLVKGEAIGLRAFLHFDLLRLFGASYLTGAAKPAIPYVKTVSGFVTPTSTVGQALDTIIMELQTASALLSRYKEINTDYYAAENRQQNDWLNHRQKHFNYWAAEATLARAYLYKGDKVKAREHAMNVIQSGLFKFYDDSRINSQADRTFVTEQIFTLSKYNLQPQVALYFQASGSVSQNESQMLTNTYGGGNVIDQLFEVSSGGGTDIRYAFLWQLSGPRYFCSKYWQSTDLRYANVVPLIRIPEMYYIAAECSTPSVAIDLLNPLRSNRGLQQLPAGLDAAAVQNEIFKEYQKEFYAEGQLFYYYKRLNMPQIRFTQAAAGDNVYILPLPDAETQHR